MPGKWIWNDAEKRREWNQWVGFRRSFLLDSVPSTATLKITADAEYRVWINGEWVGQGPARGWPDEWWYDEYDVAHLLKPGENLIAILGHSIGVSTFKYILSDAGVRAAIVSRETILVETDESWECTPNKPASYDHEIRSCCQMGWAEMLIHALPGPWLDGSRNAEDPVHRASLVLDSRPLRRSNVRWESGEVLEGKLVGERLVAHPWTNVVISLRSSLLPGYTEASPKSISGLVLLPISDYMQPEVQFEFAKNWFHVEPAVKLNGVELQRVKPNRPEWENGTAFRGRFSEGENYLLLKCHGHFHDWTIQMTVDENPVSLDLDSFVIGPLEEHELERLWESASPDELKGHGACQRVRTQWSGKIVQWFHHSESIYPVALEHSDWDKRMAFKEQIFDLGRMSVGYWEIDWQPTRPGSTILATGFESFQDGQPDFAWEMVNSTRCHPRAGETLARSLLRRGARYIAIQSYATEVTAVRCYESTYPSKLAAEFECSDERLNKIFDMCALTLRLCSEDTFVDCPTYEQTYWVGDSRVECLTNYTLYGDYELCKRCLRLAAGSLRRSEMVESHVPSGWPIVIPAWSALWAMACADTMDFIGDEQFLKDVHPAMVKQLDAFEKHFDERNLFSIDAWNLTDWSGMDQPDRGVTTANQAWITLATGATKRVCERFEDAKNSARCDAIIAKLVASTNEHLWDSKRNAYVDCVNPETGQNSEKISVQTQCLMALSGIASGERQDRCQRLVSGADSIEGFVQVGTPYFMFFVFELLDRMGDYQQIVNLSREKWGIMLDAGSTTCWEVFPGYMPGGRNTRSYCHAWSTAPAHFLIRNQLGIKPLSPTKYLFDPKPCGLTFCKGAHPTPLGPIFVEWEIVDGEMRHSIRAPREISVV